ncbi:MAG: DUF177 domain-containing protein [Actinomycetota bacterium]|jgi:uncharacterized metal-binding protein YceD (DUF177 family)|nr:hypothetical protein [Rubrobacter sp.]MDQ3507544.1 DUF177 domain-containing protein [Actinomycetota bacterium]
MNELIFLNSPDAEVGEIREYTAEASVEPFDLHGRHHEVREARVDISATKLPDDGFHLDIEAKVIVQTTCDRTLEDIEVPMEFGDSDLLSGSEDEELAVREWEFDPKAYIEKALPTEVPMQVFAPGTERMEPPDDGDKIDSRWKGLDGLFASGF